MNLKSFSYNRNTATINFTITELPNLRRTYSQIMVGRMLSDKRILLLHLVMNNIHQSQFQENGENWLRRRIR